MPVIKTLKNGVWTKVSTFGELATATSSLNGLMSSADKSKLDKVEVRDLLWTNPNPSSEFAGQTISLDLSDYESIEVVYSSYSATVFQTMRFERINSSSGGIGLESTDRSNSISSSLAVVSRNGTFDDNGVTFYDGYFQTSSGSRTVSGRSCVPQKIYGIKVG